MVAKFTYGNYIYGLLSYNEDKVQQGQAKLIYGESFPAKVSGLTKREKYRHFQNFTVLNTRTKKNAAHFTLNFHEKDAPKLSEKNLKAIALDYMSGLGLEGQPFLVYQHFDANHPHVHIVSTNINEEGERLNIFRAVQLHSENTRRDIEKEFGITVADGHQSEHPIEIDIPIYGKIPTRQAIENVIDKTLNHFSPTSLDELKLLLDRQGITMDRGSSGSQHRINDGLLFGLKGDDGVQRGVGIKASHLRNKPTSKKLQSRFGTNKLLKVNTFREVAEIVNTIFYEHLHINEKTLSKQLSANGLQLMLQRDPTGTIISLTYLHKSSGTLFNGSEFRLNQKKFIAKITGHDLTYAESGRLNKELSKIYRAGHRAVGGFESEYLKKVDVQDLVNDLMAQENQHSYETLNLVTSQFLNYKRDQIKAIYSKDLLQFNKYAVPLIRYVKQLHGLNFREKKAFLANFDLGVHEDETHFSVYSHQSPEFFLVQHKPFILSDTDLKEGVNRTVRTLSYPEKKIVQFLAERKHGHINLPEEILSMTHKNKRLKGLIDPESVHYLDRLVNKDYRNKFIEFVTEMNGKVSMDTALEYGLLIEPLSRKNGNWTYAVRAHRCPRSSSIPAGPKLTAIFNNLGYNPRNYHEMMKNWDSTSETLSLNHSLINELHRMEVTGNHSGLVRLVERTATFRPELIRTLKNMIGITSLPDNLDNMIILQLRNTFVKLLKTPEGKTLSKSEPYKAISDISSSHSQYERDSGHLSTFEDNEEELRRKKFLRKFYADLER